MTGLRVGALFAGYDGAGLAVQQLWPDTRPAWFVENDPAPAKVLARHWPDVPNLGDITQVDWTRVEPVDILTGGFPCQDVSHAGKRLGLKPGTRSGLWTHMAYVVARLRPALVLIENVRGLLSADAASDLERDCWCVGDTRETHLRALGAVLGDLAKLRYDARWVGVRAADVGAPHGRFRVFIAAYPADASGRQLSRPAPQPGPGLGGGPGGDGDPWAGGLNLPGALLPTPTSTDAKSSSGSNPDGGHGVTLTDAAGELALLPTPNASDGPHGGPGMRNGRGDADALPEVVVAGLRMASPADATERVDAQPAMAWGRYAPAIRRWEQVLGPAPPPTEPGRGAAGGPRLSPRFVEWMMGLPDGHVTDTPALSRSAMLKILGNGIVPSQMALAVTVLLDDALWEKA